MPPDEDNDDPPVYDVRLSEPAEAEIDALYLRLSAFSPDAAARWHEGLLVAIQSLTQLPRRCALVPEPERAGHELRQLLYRQGRTTYRLLFVIIDTEEDAPGMVRVLHIRNAALPPPGVE